MPKPARKALALMSWPLLASVSSTLLLLPWGCKSREFHPATVLAEVARLPQAPLAGEVENPEGFLAGLLAPPGSAERQASGEALVRAIEAAFATTPSSATLSDEQRLTKKILMTTADSLRASRACDAALRVTVYVGFEAAPLVRRTAAPLAEGVFLFPGWQEDFLRNGPQALRTVPANFDTWLKAGGADGALDWAVLAGATTPASRNTALLWASLDPLVAESAGGSVVAARVCPERLMPAIDSSNLASFGAYVPLFLLPEEIEEVADATAASCEEGVARCEGKNAVSDAFVEASSTRPVDVRYRAAYLHFPMDGEIFQEAQDAKEEPPLTLSEIAFERIKAHFYSTLLNSAGAASFRETAAEGKVPLSANECSFRLEAWKEFLKEAPTAGDGNLWTKEASLVKYKELYKGFVKSEGPCELKEEGAQR